MGRGAVGGAIARRQSIASTSSASERHKFAWPPIVEPAPAKAGGTLTLTPAQRR
jgi:hypothetical protein